MSHHFSKGISVHEVVRLRNEEPNMSYPEIAKRVGCSVSYVKWICSKRGLQKPRRSKKAEFFKLLDEHPDWTPWRIAKEIGASSTYLYALTPRRPSVMALGRAALAAGLTVKQIEEIANARHA